MDIFSSQPGAVSAVQGPGIPMSLYVQGFSGYGPMKSIITGFEIQTKSGVQFMHTLRDFIYVYVFGERMAPLTIHGASFAHVCDRMEEVLRNPLTGQSVFVPNYHGIEYALGYYGNARVSSSGVPVTIVVGLTTVLFGFLTDGSARLDDAESNVGRFSFMFQSLPQASLLDLLI